MVVCIAALALGACRCGPKQEGGGGAMKPGAGSAPADVRSEPDACAAVLAETRTGGARPGVYVEPTEEERRAARAAMAKLVAGAADADFAAARFERVPIPEWPDAVLVREVPGHPRGGGAYVVRPASRSSLVVQAPHTFYDEGTFPIACDMFRRSQARALFVNTAHRYKGAPATSDGRHPADVAHSATTLFQAMTEGVLDAVPRADVIQIHGFQNREASARAVVSSGEKQGGSSLVARAASALEAAVGPRVLKYPEDTSELGATTNVQGLLVRRSGGRFVHVEMDEALRRELLGDSALRARAIDALVGAFRSP